MSWGDVFFGFLGRINRKTYWAASILVSIAGLLFTALLSYLATGNPMAPEIWEKPADKIGIWAPVWAAYFVFLAWPSTALAVKRLHDRGAPAWLWYAYYSLSFALSLIPAKSASGGEASPAVQLLLIPLAVYTVYIFFELGVLRGIKGPNAYGEDTLPADYYGGDYSFWSWMLAPEGRISRLKWWLGILILITFGAVTSAITTLLISRLLGHPVELRELAAAEWAGGNDAAGFLLKFRAIVFALICWSFIALGIKRLHDRGLSSWLILVVVLPFLAALIAPSLENRLGEEIVHLSLLLLTASAIWSILQFGILKGETGPNRQGPDPLAG